MNPNKPYAELNTTNCFAIMPSPYCVLLHNTTLFIYCRIKLSCSLLILVLHKKSLILHESTLFLSSCIFNSIFSPEFSEPKINKNMVSHQCQNPWLAFSTHLPLFFTRPQKGHKGAIFMFYVYVYIYLYVQNM